jgi:mannitol/fructose-specific phosphotransferase system IIA component (Ntr-type)
MILADLLKAGSVKVPLESTDKQGAINELVDLLAEQGRIRDADSVKKAVWLREMTGTSGIGNGVASPHGKSGACDDLVLAIGKAASPIDYEAADGKPVDYLCLLVGPLDFSGTMHLQSLYRIIRTFTSDAFKEAATDVDTDGLFELICRIDSEQDAPA